MNAQVRIIVAIVCGYIAVFGVPSIPSVTPAPVPVVVEPPAPHMQARVKDVAEALANANIVDRMVWAETWTKAALVVQGDATLNPPAFTDTKSLREFNKLALGIAWRRIAGNPPGKYAGLAEATEAAFKTTLGMESRPVTPDMRRDYAELCKALAWAGLNRG
jgi:hypothetical protein